MNNLISVYRDKRDFFYTIAHLKCAWQRYL